MRFSKATLFTALLGAVLIVMGGIAIGGSLVGSRHDLSALNFRGYGSETGPMTGGSFNDYGEPCIYCHIPHNASDAAPLWNRQLPTSDGYKMYSSPNFDSVVPTSPDGISLACLSCHDGSLAVDAVIQTPKFHEWLDSGVHYRMSPEGGVGSDSCGKCHNQSAGAYAGLPGSESNKGAHDATVRYLTKDVRDDHPISVPYPSFAVDPQFNQPTIMKDDGGRTFPNGIQTYEGDKIQCASCHDPHNPDEDNIEGRDPFLRTTQYLSSLCLTCHDK
jgi:hypothetical protein